MNEQKKVALLFIWTCNASNQKLCKEWSSDQVTTLGWESYLVPRPLHDFVVSQLFDNTAWHLLSKTVSWSVSFMTALLTTWCVLSFYRTMWNPSWKVVRETEIVQYRHAVVSSVYMWSHFCHVSSLGYVTNQYWRLWLFKWVWGRMYGLCLHFGGFPICQILVATSVELKKLPRVVFSWCTLWAVLCLFIAVFSTNI